MGSLHASTLLNGFNDRDCPSCISFLYFVSVVVLSLRPFNNCDQVLSNFALSFRYSLRSLYLFFFFFFFLCSAFFFRLCLRFLSTAIRSFLGAVLSLRSVTSRQRGPGQSWRRCSSHRNHPDAIRCCVKLILSISDFSCQWFVRFDWCVVRSKLVQAARFARTSFDPSTSYEGIFPSSLLR